MAKNSIPYLINNQATERMIIRKEFHKALTKELFIQDLFLDEQIDIVETKSTPIHQIKIVDLKDEDVKGIWRVDLEKEISGIATKNKTPETALLILTKKESHTIFNLNVILVELKSSLQNKKFNGQKDRMSQSTLWGCEEKFQCAMNRLYMLLSLNEHNNDPVFKGSTIAVNFKGIICYNNDSTSENDSSQLYSILKKSASLNIITCETLLNQNDKIKIAFFKEKNTIRLKDLLDI